MDMNSRKAIFEDLPVRRAVIRQIIPAIASQMVVLLYNLADAYFVGMLNRPEQTAALTVSTSAFLMLTAISNLFGVGGASAVARSLGRKDPDRARRISAVTFWGGLASGLAYAALVSLLAAEILTLCGATAETLPAALRYMRWTVIVGGPFSVMSMLLSNLIRAEGRPGTASTGVMLGCVLNILLDPIFVLPGFLNMGAEGAGLATAISNITAVAYFLIYLLRSRKTTIITVLPGRLPDLGALAKEILSVGFPSALQYALTVVAVAAQARFVSHYATEAVAALGIMKKLDYLPMYFAIGVSNGLLPLLAYSHGAGLHQRRREAFRFGTVISVSFALLCLGVYELFAPQLSALFIDDPVTIRYAAAFLRRTVVAMPLMAFCYPMVIQFQAMGRVRESLIVSVLRKGVLDIPLLALTDWLYPLYGCMWVQPIVDTISLAVSVRLYRKMGET